jgi:hypothetical protein
VRSWLERVGDSGIDGRPVAAMRISVNALFLLDLIRILPRHDTLYWLGPWQLAGLLLWAFLTLCVALGLFTRVAAALSFVTGFVFTTFGGVNYHVDFYQQITTFYLMLMDAGRCWSIDAWRLRHVRSSSREIWALPVLAFMLHYGTVYLDAGTSHLIANESWREGFAVAQSLCHPQWSAPIGRLMGRVPVLAVLFNWATVVFEILFVACLAPFLVDPRRRHWVTVLALIGIGLHLGITVCYDLGYFGPQLVLILLAFLPPSWYERMERRVRGERGRETNDPPAPPRRPPGRVERLAVRTVLAVLVPCAVLVQPTVRALLDKAMVEELAMPLTWPALVVFEEAAGLLRSIGDRRPHNVFSQYSQSVSFAFEIVREGPLGPEPWPILFRSSGERSGYTRYMRGFMVWYYVGQRMAHAQRGGARLGAGWQPRVERQLSPLIVREAAAGRLVETDELRLYFRAWSTPRRCTETFPEKIGEQRVELATVRIRRRGAETLVEYDYVP